MKANRESTLTGSLGTISVMPQWVPGNEHLQDATLHTMYRTSVSRNQHFIFKVLHLGATQ